MPLIRDKSFALSHHNTPSTVLIEQAIGFSAVRFGAGMRCGGDLFAMVIGNDSCVTKYPVCDAAMV